MARIKGFAIRGLLRYAKEHGIPPLDLVRELPDPALATFERPILHGELYPYEAFQAVLQVLARRLPGEAKGPARDLGRSAAREDIRGILRIVTPVTSPETAIHRATVLWTRYLDTGRVEAEEVRPGYFRVAMEDFPGIDPLHCRMIEGWMEAFGEVWGAADVRVNQTECVHAGGRRCVFEGRWGAGG